MYKQLLQKHGDLVKYKFKTNKIHQLNKIKKERILKQHLQDFHGYNLLFIHTSFDYRRTSEEHR